MSGWEACTAATAARPNYSSTSACSPCARRSTPPRPPSPWRNPWEALAGYVQACVAIGAGAFAPLAGTIEVTGEMLATAKKASRLRRRLVVQARRGGRLRPDVTDVDIWALIEQFSRASANPDSGDDPVIQARLLTIVIDGLGSKGATPLPGPAPDRHANARRWTTSAWPSR